LNLALSLFIEDPKSSWQEEAAIRTLLRQRKTKKFLSPHQVNIKRFRQDRDKVMEALSAPPCLEGSWHHEVANSTITPTHTSQMSSQIICRTAAAYFKLH
jgi:hypothetical protein